MRAMAKRSADPCNTLFFMGFAPVVGLKMGRSTSMEFLYVCVATVNSTQPEGGLFKRNCDWPQKN